ncbi:hypothetical protein [Phyllobacterium myrsinacearum]|uniref:Uncharacterized protein n=1 Tax=Phyllobacterium myrsinacearum TaxID=28101 RepID=A0A839EEC3_9HYPH|nr:hypothetical protein [Phyllobacterium myrsinacearum]MBA8878291.1 hypothetical protein [Phyllobacterium myrsinacearum]
MAIYDHVNVKLTETDSDAMSLMARVSKSLRQGGVEKRAIDKVINEALSGNYDKALATIMKYVNVH